MRGARLHVAGLGIYTADVNGRPVGDAVLEPANTTFADRVQYATYDVTDLLRHGDNTIGVALGNGMSNVVSTADRYRKLYGNLSDPKLIAQLEVTLGDGTVKRIASGADWRTVLGPTTSSNWYGGEDYDARREIPHWDQPHQDRSAWSHAVTVDGPGTPGHPTQLSARETEPIRVEENLKGTEVSGAAPGSRIFDLGRNIAGWPEITLDAPAGTTVRIYPAESLKDGHAFQSISNVGAPCGTATPHAAKRARPGTRSSPTTASATWRSRACRPEPPSPCAERHCTPTTLPRVTSRAPTTWSTASTRSPAAPSRTT